MSALDAHLGLFKADWISDPDLLAARIREASVSDRYTAELAAWCAEIHEHPRELADKREIELLLLGGNGASLRFDAVRQPGSRDNDYLTAASPEDIDRLMVRLGERFAPLQPTTPDTWGEPRPESRGPAGLGPYDRLRWGVRTLPPAGAEGSALVGQVRRPHDPRRRMQDLSSLNRRGVTRVAPRRLSGTRSRLRPLVVGSFEHALNGRPKVDEPVGSCAGQGWERRRDDQLGRPEVGLPRARGWLGRAGPPFDPIELAELLGVEVIAVEGVADARLVHIGRRPRIEFNPSRPRARVRFSIAHELGHLLFPDAADKVRYRSHSDDRRRDDWEVELLCNFAAAEFLMPVGSLPQSATTDLEINHLMRLRARFEVSAEALLLRVIDLTAEPAAAFAAARLMDDQPRFRIDYCMAGRAWRAPISAHDVVHGGPLADCTAIEYTATGEMTIGERLHVECVGVPGYPGQRYPRVVGILRPRQRVTPGVAIGYVDGDATAPRGDGP